MSRPDYWTIFILKKDSTLRQDSRSNPMTDVITPNSFYMTGMDNSRIDRFPIVCRKIHVKDTINYNYNINDLIYFQAITASLRAVAVLMSRDSLVQWDLCAKNLWRCYCFVKDVGLSSCLLCFSITHIVPSKESNSKYQGYGRKWRDIISSHSSLFGHKKPKLFCWGPKKLREEDLLQRGVYEISGGMIFEDTLYPVIIGLRYSRAAARIVS